MNIRLRFPLLMVVMMAMTGLNSWAISPNSSPNLQAAIESLEAAKTAPDPDPSLQEALKHLHKATNNAGNKRDEAIVAVDQAVKLEKDADKRKLHEKIDNAIALLHTGIRMGARHR